MDQKNFCYVFYDDISSPKLVDKDNLTDLLKNALNPYIFTCFTNEEAIAKIEYESSRFKKKNDQDTSVSSRKQYKSSQNSNAIANDKLEQNSKATPEDHAKPDTEGKTSKDSAPLSVKSEIYGRYKIDQTTVEDKKKLVIPSEIYILNFDGGSKNNPGHAGAGYLIRNQKKDIIFKSGVYLGINTSNRAEYSGLVYGLKTALTLGVKKLDVIGDSQLVIKQLKGEYQVRKEELKPYYAEAKDLISKFELVTLNWVRREENSEADELANQGISSR